MQVQLQRKSVAELKADASKCGAEIDPKKGAKAGPFARLALDSCSPPTHTTFTPTPPHSE
eukprot:11058063-Alexandrium_andersonii.AAC.1